jgi:hypothetical protein
VELGGLKAIFPVFMGRGWSAALKKKKQGEREVSQVMGPDSRNTGSSSIDRAALCCLRGSEGLRGHAVWDARGLGEGGGGG